MKITDQYVFFVETECPFSNWHPAEFEYKGNKFKNSEQAMMWEKANTFNDQNIAQKVLMVSDPKEVKALGRSIQNYKEDVWSAVRKDLVTEILKCKFAQNPSMKMELLDTKNRILVEAAHYDNIWGVGLKQNDPAILDPKNWKGLNLLGQALMDTRDYLNGLENRKGLGLKK